MNTPMPAAFFPPLPPIDTGSATSIAKALATCEHPEECRVRAELVAPDTRENMTWCGACGAMHIQDAWVRPALALAAVVYVEGQ